MTVSSRFITTTGASAKCSVSTASIIDWCLTAIR